jgi:hypothetical protein
MSLDAMSSNATPPDDNKRAYRRDLWLASLLVTTGLVVSGLSLAEISARDLQQTAQATQPLQSTPGAETKPSTPAEPTTTGTRPSGVSPEPARPNAEAQKDGAQPALPAAPAEKIAPPIQGK